jgi:hypothetical protein
LIKPTTGFLTPDSEVLVIRLGTLQMGGDGEEKGGKAGG